MDAPTSAQGADWFSWATYVLVPIVAASIDHVRVYVLNNLGSIDPE